MVTTRSLAPPPSPPPPAAPGFPGKDDGYERCRDQRIRENLERMQKLGIADLALKLKSQNLLHTTPRRRPYTRKTRDSTPRRSSRLQTSTPVSYVEVAFHKEERKLRRRTVEVVCKDEVYTEEHAKLLGSCGTAWTLYVDGCGPDGKRVYDQVNGKTCHQCRQKTLGHRTQCSRCEMVQGQFCGDCLFMRYGENVFEANKNPDWICPVCRGICNCSLCRVKKGWPPTGSLYRTISSLGYKSVAHYLIQTRRLQTNLEKPCFADPVSAKKSLPFNDTKDPPLSNNILMLEYKVEPTVDSGDLHNDESKDEGSVKIASHIGSHCEVEEPKMKEIVTDVATVATSEYVAQSVRKRIDMEHDLDAYDNSDSGCTTDKQIRMFCEDKQRQVEDTYLVLTPSPKCIAGRLRSNGCKKEKQTLMSGENKRRKKNNLSQDFMASPDCIAGRLRSIGIHEEKQMQVSDVNKRKKKALSLTYTPSSDCIAGRLRKRMSKP